MKLNLFLLLSLLPMLILAQTSTKEVYRALEGSWVKLNVEWVDDDHKEALPDYHRHYLKYEWSSKKKLSVYGSYLANGVEVSHQLKGRKLSFSFGRHFIIEEVDEQNLVMVELDGGPSGEKTIRFEFIREPLYIDALPLSSDDYMVEPSGDTLFFDSEKFHPRFSHKQYPDFHLYVHNQVKRYYPKGENYFYASFEINPDSKISQVQVFAGADKKSSEKAIEAIRKSEGMWTLPELNGRGVRVLVTIEDRYNNSGLNTSLSSNQNDISQRYSDAFVRAHQKATRLYLRKRYDDMPEWLDRCEKMQPNDPNYLYLKYLYSQAIGNGRAVKTYKEKLANTSLKFLLNQGQ